MPKYGPTRRSFLSIAKRESMTSQSMITTTEIQKMWNLRNGELNLAHTNKRSSRSSLPQTITILLLLLTTRLQKEPNHSLVHTLEGISKGNYFSQKVTVTNDSRNIMAASEDDTVKIWNLKR